MEEVVDCVHLPLSPEELAIHFLMRHTACRRALIEQAEGELQHQRTRRSSRGTFVEGPVFTGFRQPAMPAPEVTANDSCAARFSRAYAAARHTSTPRPA